MQRTKWTERKFSFDFPEGWMPDIQERLYGTPVRLRHMVAGISDEQAAMRLHGDWSIKEHIGHLIDLEELHEGRIDDFEAGRETLRAADMTNAKTYAAAHNTKTLAQLLGELQEVRNRFIHHIEALNDTILLSTAMHPRLQVKMRPVDVAFFTAEHDDHHLADIRILLHILNRQQ
jgi:hypothetical protein